MPEKKCTHLDDYLKSLLFINMTLPLKSYRVMDNILSMNHPWEDSWRDIFHKQLTDVLTWLFRRDKVRRAGRAGFTAFIQHKLQEHNDANLSAQALKTWCCEQWDQWLLDGMVAGRTDATDYLYKRLYRDTYPSLLRHIRQQGGRRSDADDVFQEAFLKFMQLTKAGQYEYRPGEATISTYFQVVARGRWRQETRRSVNSKRVHGDIPESPDTAPDAVAQMTADEEQSALFRAISTLGEVCRTILLGFFFEEKSYAEIAPEVNMQPHSVKNTKYRCMKKLKHAYFQ